MPSGTNHPTWTPRKKFSRYLENFLKSPEGSFYTSQDADLVPGEHSADYFALSDTASEPAEFRESISILRA